MYYYFRQSDLKLNHSANGKGTVKEGLIEIISDQILEPGYQYYLSGSEENYTMVKGDLYPTAE